MQKEEDICELTGISAGTVNKTLALLRLPESVLSVMRERPNAIGIAAGYELTLYYKLAGEDRTRELATRIMTDGLSSREVESIRKQVQEGKSRKVKEISRQYKIRTDGGQLLGTIKEWDSGRVMLDVQLSDRSAREALVEALKARLASTIRCSECPCTTPSTMLARKGEGGDECLFPGAAYGAAVLICLGVNAANSSTRSPA